MYKVGPFPGAHGQPAIPVPRRSCPKTWQHLPTLAPHRSLLAKGTVVLFFLFYFFKNPMWGQEKVGRGGGGGTKINALKCGVEAMEVSGEPAMWGSREPPPCLGRAVAFEAPGSHADSPSAAKAAPNHLAAPSQNFPSVPGAVGTQRCPSAPGRRNQYSAGLVLPPPVRLALHHQVASIVFLSWGEKKKYQKTNYLLCIKGSVCVSLC